MEVEDMTIDEQNEEKCMVRSRSVKGLQVVLAFLQRDIQGSNPKWTLHKMFRLLDTRDT